ncbi:ATP-binding protein [Humisphaera borealis]|uniref:histidine kinase n=1 Tax=Humisphaera borealis TaxID=2807512 RepID=A0A7M2WZC2_9BACT|nr:ATP-binding protein [Humisphaera borealis]QOV90714.1 GAF domain-containing protein [Humisphaera borealis]
MKDSVRTITETPPELSGCDSEPIRTPGSIQGHGVLLVVDAATAVIRRVSANAVEHPSGGADRLIGSSLSSVLGKVLADKVMAVPPGESPMFIETTRPRSSNGAYHVLAHRMGSILLVELEETGSGEPAAFDVIYPVLQSLVSKLLAAKNMPEACAVAAGQVRELTGFDRVLVYQFDPDWNGIVVAEDRNDRLPSYLGQRFPASDIPAQARDLYRVNPVRLIPDASYTPVPLRPADSAHEPLDLSYASLRSVSPLHAEYMRNMGTAASMSVSIVVAEKLWGLIACHNAQPRRVPFHVRTACVFLGQVLSQQVAAHSHAEQYTSRMALKSYQSRLLAEMAGESEFLRGLTADKASLLNLTGSTGAAIVSAQQCILIGQTPGEAKVRALSDWLESRPPAEVFWTHQLSAAFPESAEYADLASGVLAISVSKLHARYLIWFRPELIRTLSWAGDPNKNAPDIHTGRIHPRHSFDVWKQIVRNTSEPWTDAQIEAATELRNHIVGIVLRKAEEVAELAGELEQSNKELEAFSYSVSHDLRAPFRHIVGYAELLRQDEANGLSATGKRYIETIIESAQYAGTLVDNLLTFSQMGRAALSMSAIDLNLLFQEGWREQRSDIGERHIAFAVAPLPTVQADLMMLRLVVQNLLSNAVKYTSTTPQAKVDVGYVSEPSEHVIFVRDNGVGFDMKYVGKLFGVFQRLHRMEEFEGTGIGLANVRRIISRHGGRTWAEGEPGKGAVIYFTLPKNEPQDKETHG